MKKFYLTFLIVLTSMSAFAVPAKRGLWKTVKMADGTEVKVELRGDEFCKFWRTADGVNLVKNNKTGFYEKANLEQMSRLANERRQNAARLSPSNNALSGETRISYTGKKKGLIILVQFSDLKFKETNTLDLYKRIVNEVGFSDESIGFKGSVKDYFFAQSYGQMEFDFDIVGPVTMPNSYKYYGKNNAYTGSDENVGEMVMEACKAVDDQVDYKQYDWDGNRDVEQVFIIYAGHGEASYPDDNTIWPHKYSIRSATGKMLTLDGVVVDTYACSCELGQTEKIDGIGTICHEFSHCLGLPDFYDTQYGGDYGTHTWDLMCQGSYNGDSFSPANYTAYERMYVGWLQPTVLTDDVQVSSMQPLGDSPEAYIIYNDNNENEYYMLENRQRTGWDEYLPNSGLLITHIDYNKRAWDYNVPNSTSGQSMYGISNPHERCAIVLADNSSSYYNPEGDVYPYGYNNSLTNTSTPAASLYNSNTDGSLYLNKSVRDIVRNGDGTISFSFENENKNSGDYDLPSSYIFYESFDRCDGVGGNDGKFSGSTVGKGTFSGYTDNEGWSSTSPHGAQRCAMFGSSMVPGQVITPEINIDGEYHLLFKAAPYTGDGNVLTLEVEEGDAALSKTEFVMLEDQWSAYDVTITGNGPVKVKIKATKRFFLDKVCVASDVTSGVVSPIVSGQNNGRIFTIDGRYVGKDLNALKKGIYIINGKKIVK